MYEKNGAGYDATSNGSIHFLIALKSIVLKIAITYWLIIIQRIRETFRRRGGS